MPDAPLVRAFEAQIGWCREPSPFTARLLERSLRFVQREPSAFDALAAAAPDPLAGAVTLRWAAALHHLALRGLQPWSALWPPAAAAAADAALDEAIETAWATQRPHLRRALAHAPQTNEVQRSAILLPGLLALAAAAGRPLALLEIGASAGLNLWPERHRYDFGAWQWGDAAAPLVLRAGWRGGVPARAALAVARRAGCDLQPIDITQPDEALRLQSFVWADQAERIARLVAARDLAARWLHDDGVRVQGGRAADFVRRELAAAAGDALPVVMHSIVWQYIEPAEQREIEATIAGSGAAWLRFEPPVPERRPELRLHFAGTDRLLAGAHAHVASIEWHA